MSASLTPQDFALHERCFITPELVAQARLYRVTSSEGAQLVGRNGNADYAGIVFPNIWPGEDAAREYRLRRDRPEFEQKGDVLKEKNKYLSPPGRSNLFYIPPGTPAEYLADATITADFTEGEKKALALHRYHMERGERVLVIGLPGVWNWRGTVGKTNDEKGERRDVTGPIPDFDRVVWKKRRVYIIFDSNVRSNESVAAARAGLAKELKRRGADVRLVDLPEIEGVNGVDDLLYVEGPDFLTTLIEEAEAHQPKSTNRACKSQATILVELAKDAELFHDPDHEAYATIKVGGHLETWLISSRGFRNYLARLFYQAEKSIPAAPAVQEALSGLIGQALFDNPTHHVHTRLAEHEGAIYLDLCDEPWRVVRITRDGWKVIDDSPMKFRRAKGMLALPVPAQDGSVQELREFVNVKDDGDFILLLAWVVAALRGGARNYPILDITGEQGSAKTTTSRVCRALVDPNKAAVRSVPRDEQDLSIAARNGWVIALDNLSSLQQWKSDALCRLSTGGGFATRELYTNDDETIFDATRPILLNGIEDVATRPDLLDRTIILQLPEIMDARRRDEKEFWEKFEAARPRILGALLDCVACALRNLPSVRLNGLPRMADFAQWATAAEPAMGVNQGSFINAYMSNRSKANEWALEASPVALTLIAVMKKRGGWTWTVTLKDLMDSLNAEFGDGKRPDEWPKTSRGLAGALTRCAPNLRKAGWSVTDPGREGGSGLTRRTITRIDDDRKESSQPSHSSQADDNGHPGCEDSREDWGGLEDTSSQEKADEYRGCEGREGYEGEKPTHSSSEVEYETPEEAAEREAILDYYAGDQEAVRAGRIVDNEGHEYHF